MAVRGKGERREKKELREQSHRESHRTAEKGSRAQLSSAPVSELNERELSPPLASSSSDYERAASVCD
jgi:hypothetical protein